MIRKLFLQILLFASSVFCYAVDPPFTPIEEALQKGKVVFVGMVESLVVSKQSGGSVSVKAKVLIEECLLGERCKKGSYIDVEYLAQSVIGTSLPVKLQVAEQVILVLKNTVDNTPYVFDSDINEGTDYAFMCNAFPYSITDEYSQFRCQNSMTKKKTKPLTFKNIKAMLHP